jgi:Mg/Co/Ni transporter MgtE
MLHTLLSNATTQEIANIPLNNYSPDDVATALKGLPQDKTTQILNNLPQDERTAIMNKLSPK